jgi:hypothetical protein
VSRQAADAIDSTVAVAFCYRDMRRNCCCFSRGAALIMNA